MSRKVAFGIAGLAFAASAGMYIVGSDSSHLSELADLFWLPLPLGVLAVAIGMKKSDA